MCVLKSAGNIVYVKVQVLTGAKSNNLTLYYIHLIKIKFRRLFNFMITLWQLLSPDSDSCFKNLRYIRPRMLLDNSEQLL